MRRFPFHLLVAAAIVFAYLIWVADPKRPRAQVPSDRPAEGAGVKHRRVPTASGAIS